MLAGGRLPGVLRFPDPPLSDSVITLRERTPADVDALVAACQDPEISRWTRVPVPYFPEHALEWIAASEQELAAGHAIHWLAFDAAGTLLASVGLMEIGKERGYGEIGYWVARDARGRGVAKRGVDLVREWAQRELGLTTLELVIHEDNHHSRAVARSAGFAETGERRRSPRGGLPDGAYLVHLWGAPSSA
jgi:RimJ/RimL family protein N-acetyltransferase